ncbi:MAG: hypothetical protein AUJ58_03430 [Zetaproteobacteria bacterium CG1_02_55_237]|nr:MAG: hypothetical protein AUJ58_03430 [Zetaproteobacteria bacterium CG1_02_55_237]
MNKSLIAAGLLIATSLAVPAFACPAGGQCNGQAGAQGMQQGMQRMTTDLNLSAEQQEQVKKIHNDSRETMKAMRDAMLANRDAMQKLDPAAKDYTARADKLAEEKGTLVEAMMKENARVRAEMSAVLTPEQRAKAAQLRKERKAKRDAKKGERRGDWGKGRGGPDGRGPGNGPGKCTGDCPQNK